MAINDVTRNLGPSLSQSHTSEAIGHAEDYSKIITNISPDVALFLSRFSNDADATTLKFGWLTEGLRPPKTNAHLEKEDYTASKLGSLEAAENNCQRFVNDGYVTEAQRKVSKVYDPQDEKARLLDICLREHAQEIEYALVNNDITRPENGNNPALTGGVPYFMATQTIGATLSTTDGVVTTSEEHHLQTGDFVYFSGTAMPTGLAANTIYYVRLDATTPATKFIIFNTQKDAVENKVGNQVKPTTAGTALKIVKNNVIDLQGASDYTLDDINRVMEMAFYRGGNPTLAVMSPAKKRKFSQLVISNTTINRDMAKGGKLDMVADVYQTDYGTVTAEAHRLYPDNRIDILDMQYWALKWFEHTHEVTGIAKKGSYDEFYVTSWLGLKGTQPKASASLINIKR